jgi:hypothetical protein
MQHVVKPENKTRFWSAMFYLEDTIGGMGAVMILCRETLKGSFGEYCFPFWTSFWRFSCDLPKFRPVTLCGEALWLHSTRKFRY